VGLDPLEQLKLSNIGLEELSNPDNWLAARSVADLLERSALESGRSDFSLLLAECRSLASLGPLSLLLKHEASPRRIVHQINHFKRHLNDIFDVHLEESDDLTLLRWTVPAAYATPQIVILVTAVGYRALVESMNGSWVPERIHFPFARPAIMQTFHRFFARPIDFDSEFSGFSFPTSDLDQPNPSADEHMANHAAALLRMVAPPPESIADRARHALVLLLPVGKGALGNVANNLGIQSRALQRELNDDDLTFAELLNETRRDLAKAYLTNPNRTVSEVATLVGYSSASSFSRWFSDEYGISPSRWRRAQRK
jgi:AraC-like DNA-binding protein